MRRLREAQQGRQNEIPKDNSIGSQMRNLANGVEKQASGSNTMVRTKKGMVDLTALEKNKEEVKEEKIKDERIFNEIIKLYNDGDISSKKIGDLFKQYYSAWD